MKPAPRFRRGGPDLWIESAYAILAEEGDRNSKRMTPDRG